MSTAKGVFWSTLKSLFRVLFWKRFSRMIQFPMEEIPPPPPPPVSNRQRIGTELAGCTEMPWTNFWSQSARHGNGLFTFGTSVLHIHYVDCDVSLNMYQACVMNVFSHVHCRRGRRQSGCFHVVFSVMDVGDDETHAQFVQ